MHALTIHQRPMDTLESYLATQTETAVTGNSQLLREVAYERIKDAIRHGMLQPGEPLSEPRLSKLLGISRTPVREALQVLAQEGLVQVIPGRAITVAAPSMQDTLNIIQVRAILEPEVVRLATPMLSQADFDELRRILDEMDEAVRRGDRQAWSKADTRYHELLSARCPNQLLGELAIQMRNRVSYIPLDTRSSPERLAACTYEHRVIVERMAERDAAGAEQAMRVHIKNLWESTFRRFHPAG